MSARRIIVERSIADEFVERLAEKTRTLKAGDPKEHGHDHRAADQRGRARDGAERGRGRRREGRAVLAGGEAVGPCFQATLLADVPEDSELAKRETFGPVARSRSSTSADEAVARANATTYGLSAGIITSDADRGFALAQRIDAGIVHVNDQPSATSRRCRSAASRTRLGRFGGQAVIDEFTELRWVTVTSGRIRSRSECDRSAQRGGRELVRDGDTVALEGFTHLIPHAAGHELIRQGGAT
jgi:acyl-CoA reductase-like NAD-dependent aldehyde dehydrogenase